jgi:hypothetical protein
MLPWDKKFINQYIPRSPKTIFYSDGSCDVQNVCENIIRNLLDQILNPGLKNKDLYQLSSPNLLCLKCEDDEKFIPIEKLRKAKEFMQVKSMNVKVLYISESEKIRVDGFNTLLKLTEETDEKQFIWIAAKNLTVIPKTILSRFSKVKLPHPSRKEIMEHISQYSFKDSQIEEFLIENPSYFQKENFEKDILNFTQWLKTKQISSIDKEQFTDFVDFLIFIHKKSVLQNGLKFKQKIFKLQEIKKELMLPNNLNLDILKLKVNSCL